MVCFTMTFGEVDAPQWIVRKDKTMGEGKITPGVQLEYGKYLWGLQKMAKSHPLEL